MKKLLALILAAITALSLFACGGNGDKKDPEKPDGIPLVDENGEALFTIVSYAKAGQTVTGLVNSLRAEIRKGTGVTLRVTYAIANKDEPDSYQFLIGSTGKPESVELAEGIGPTEYRVKLMGKKVVVVGGSDMALTRGVSELLSIIDYENKLLPKVIDIKGELGGDGAMLVGMANQTKKQVEVYDISSGNMNATSLLWSVKTGCSTISGFKFRNHPTHGEVVLIIGGADAEMISYETKEVLWKTNNSSANGHSLELLPNGVIVTGGTVGHDLHFYNPNGTNPKEILLEIPFRDAHGLLWDPKYEVLWAAGEDQLTAFEVTLNDDGTVTATKNEELSFVTPESGLHDLQPYTGNDDYLLISTSTHVYVYDKVNKTTTDAYKGVQGATTDHVKGVGRFENGDMFYMFYDGGNDNGQGGGWNTTYLTYIVSGSKSVGQVPSDQGRFYKCRAWYSDYQP